MHNLTTGKENRSRHSVIVVLPGRNCNAPHRVKISTHRISTSNTNTIGSDHDNTNTFILLSLVQ